MTKVTLNDITSKSQNVIDLFNIPVDERTLAWLRRYHYTNDELLEILNLAQNMESQWNRRQFFQRLILSQPGPFNEAVFVNVTPKLFCIDTLIHLLTYSTDITEQAKLIWLQYICGTSSQWFTLPFFLNGDAAKCGVDIYQSAGKLRQN